MPLFTVLAASSLALVIVDYPRVAQFVPANPGNQVVGGLDDPIYVIIHTQEGWYDGTISWFQSSISDVSTHFVMRSSDGEVTQMVELDDMAQHIGGYNPRSFGIEHEGFMFEPGWYTWETYVESARITRWLCDNFDIVADREHILGHNDVPGGSPDPGPYWDWGIYMALVHDVVPQGRIEGVLVDASAPCVLTAMQDTWITTTMEAPDDLEGHETCFVAAGTELAYLHASPDMASQHRLILAGDGPCGLMGVDDGATFMWGPAFSPLCDATDLAVSTGMMVRVDDEEVSVDGDGAFAIEGLAPGEHVIDVTTDGTWAPTSAVVDLEGYPGVRVVIPVEPADADPDPPDDDDDDDDGSTGTVPVGTTGTDHDTDDGPGLPAPEAPPPLQESGCTCDVDDDASAPGYAAAGLLLLLGGFARRPRP